MGTKYAAAEAWAPSNSGVAYMDGEGVLHVPLLKGQHVLGFEVALKHWLDPDAAKTADTDKRR